MTSLERTAAAVRASELDPVALLEQATRGPLAGIPVLVKEIIEVEGMPYRCGSAVHSSLMRHVRLPNITGHPAITIPLKAPGLPVGLQLIARDNQKASAVAAWIEGQL
ncbi:amidase family protein [Kribbella sp. CA-294648]|uniref:amidase family protein n=1 Tax=Kribbella sp. CA-294648 TaxID=3239948 RepID=UPI003D915C7E